MWPMTDAGVQRMSGCSGSTVKQEVVLKQLLPIAKNEAGFPGETEPEPEELLDFVFRDFCIGK